LTIRAALLIARDRLSGKLPPRACVGLLDGPPMGVPAIAAAYALRRLGLRLEVVSFFAGHLRTATGEAVRPAARKAAFRMAFEAATTLLDGSRVLSDVNARWQRDTVRLYLARRLWPAAERLLLRAMVVQALGASGGGPLTLVIPRPVELPPGVVRALVQNVTLQFAGLQRSGWRTGRLAPTLRWARQLLRGRRSQPPEIPADGLPAVLLLQEDDVSLDRSYRTQPHWLSPGDTPPFRTVILRLGPAAIDAPLDALERHRIDVVSPDEPVSSSERDLPICGRLRRDSRRLRRVAIFHPDPAVACAAGEVATLTATAEGLAALAVRRRVRAFLTCENYMLHADAMQLIGAPLGIKTLSYQYTSLPYPSLALMTTAGAMITFAPLYHPRWTWPGLTPPRFVDAGYVHDSSFALLRDRAAERCARLRAAGASFVIGVFDESVQRDKYGLVSLSEYEAHLELLLARVVDDRSLGLVFKTQFHHNLDGMSDRLRDALNRGLATGRVELPAHGRHRNTVFPAEVALSSDITIGFAIGSTASLEAALAGCRSLIVNAHGLMTDADALYLRADIQYPTLADALHAIDRYRRGEPAQTALGDWSDILPEFDPFRDGRSAARLRTVIEEAIEN
jgi:hypothetical protein